MVQTFLESGSRLTSKNAVNAEVLGNGQAQGEPPGEVLQPVEILVTRLLLETLLEPKFLQTFLDATVDTAVLQPGQSASVGSFPQGHEVFPPRQPALEGQTEGIVQVHFGGPEVVDTSGCDRFHPGARDRPSTGPITLAGEALIEFSFHAPALTDRQDRLRDFWPNLLVEHLHKAPEVDRPPKLAVESQGEHKQVLMGMRLTMLIRRVAIAQAEHASGHPGARSLALPDLDAPELQRPLDLGGDGILDVPDEPRVHSGCEFAQLARDGQKDFVKLLCA